MSSKVFTKLAKCERSIIGGFGIEETEFCEAWMERARWPAPVPKCAGGRKYFPPRPSVLTGLKKLIRFI